MRGSDAVLWFGKRKVRFDHNIWWFEGKKRAKIGVNNARVLPPFSAKNTDAEADFLDIVLKMIPKSFLGIKDYEIKL